MYKMGDVLGIYLELTDSLKPQELQVKKVGKDYQVISIGTFFEATARPAVNTFSHVTNVIADALLMIAAERHSDPKPIEQARDAFLTNGPDSLIKLTRKKIATKKLSMEPQLKFKGCSWNTVQMYVTVTDSENAISGTKMICETSEPEAFSLAGKFALKGETLLVLPEKGMWEQTFANCYRERGFSVPMQIDLAQILGTATTHGGT